MNARPVASRWVRIGLPAAMAVVVLAPVRWTVRVDGWPTAIVIAATAAVVVVVSGRVPEERWPLRLALALGAGVVAERLGGGLAGAWVLVAVVLCDWAIRRRRPAPVVPPGGEAAAVVVSALNLVAFWLAGHAGSAVVILMVLAWALLATLATGLVRPSEGRCFASALRSLRSAGDAVIGALRDRRSRWSIATLGAIAWAIANVVWFEFHRGARLWDHEEVTYSQLVSYFASGEGGEPWSGLFVGHYGPMQALLGAPFQWAFGVNEATVVYLNIGLTAVTGLLVFWMVSRLADPVAGLVAGALVLLTPGMLENARGALTMVPATTFAALAMAALVAGRGLRRWQWAAVGGVALGCMSLSRPMSIAFIPGLAVPAIVWSLRSATPWRTILRNSALAGTAAVVVSIWWWAPSASAVLDYLATGAEGVATGSVVEVLDHRLYELSAYIGPISSSSTLGYWWYLAAGAFGVLYLVSRRTRVALAPRGRAAGTRAAPTPPDFLGPSPRPDDTAEALDPLPLWPLWAAVAVDLVVSLASNTIGWLMLPVVPWMIAATVAGVRRMLPTRAWRAWAAVVVVPVLVVAVLTSTLSVTPGNRFTWCMEPWQTTSACRVDDRTQAAEWKTDIRRIVDESLDLQAELVDDARNETLIAVAARDHIVLSGILRYQAWIDHRRGWDGTTFLESDLTSESHVDQIREGVGVIVVSPDVDPYTLAPSMVDPDELVPELPALGFAECRRVALPDGRVVQTFVRLPLPASVCD